MKSTRTAPSYRDAPPRFIAGERCLDFLNTVEWRGDSDARGERLGDYEELILWARAAGCLSRDEATRLLGSAKRRPRKAAAVVKEAVRVREALVRLIARGARGGESLGAFNALLRRVRFRFRVTVVDGTMHRISVGDREQLRQPLDRVILAALDLLTSERLGHVGSCRNARCGWFFLDASRNKSRRWCDMAACGNNAKARAHYRRRRAAAWRRSRAAVPSRP